MTTRLRDANPYSDEQVDALALHGEDALREAILRHRARPARRRWQWAGLTAGMVATAATLAVVFVGGSTPERAWSAEAVRVAESVPRLLLPGWEVVRADEFVVDDGEMELARGDLRLQLNWRGVRGFRSWVRSRAHESVRLPDAAVPGGTALVFRYKETDDDHTALWRAGRFTMELRGSMSEEEFAAALGSLEAVDVDTWLSAMPESVVLPVDNREVVDGMLADMPVPDGFDADTLVDSRIRDRYQLGAKVAGAVTCAWIARYYEGDRAEATAALETARDWKVLGEMRSQGAYPDVLWEHVDAVLGDGTIIGGKELPVRDVYKEALGC
jgi:hypothetical protein